MYMAFFCDTQWLDQTRYTCVWCIPSISLATCLQSDWCVLDIETPRRRDVESKLMRTGGKLQEDSLAARRLSKNGAWAKMATDKYIEMYIYTRTYIHTDVSHAYIHMCSTYIFIYHKCFSCVCIYSIIVNAYFIYIYISCISHICISYMYLIYIYMLIYMLVFFLLFLAMTCPLFWSVLLKMSGLSDQQYLYSW